MESGGVSKSMSSLLNTIDTKRFDVDCFILAPQGIFINSIPKEINIITNQRTALLFSKFPQNIGPLLKNAYFVDVFIRTFAAMFMLFNKGVGGWLLSRRIYKIKKEYDLAVDYNGQHQLYYLIDSINATKKATFFHSDYEKWAYYYTMDKKYMPKANHIFTISDKCVQSLVDYFPEEQHKIQLFENISSRKTIIKMADEQVTDQLDTNGYSLITIGHVCETKGASLAIKAAKLLKDKGIMFKWYFIGRNDNEALYKSLVVENNLQEHILFVLCVPLWGAHSTKR